jgi:hypothetical protein
MAYNDTTKPIPEGECSGCDYHLRGLELALALIDKLEEIEARLAALERRDHVRRRRRVA